MGVEAYDLQLHRLAIELDRPDFLRRSASARPMVGLVVRTYKVDADGGDVRLCVGVVGEPQQQARLADTGVADEQQLEEVVVSSILSAAATGGRAGVRVGGRRRCRKMGDASGEEDAGEDRSVSSKQRRKREAVEATHYSGFMVGDAVRNAGKMRKMRRMREMRSDQRRRAIGGRYS